MNFSYKYKPLFSINLFHDYYLNKGSERFTDMEEVEKEKQLIGYNFSNLFSVQATAETRKIIEGHQMVFTTLNTGFAILTRVSHTNSRSPFINIYNNLELSFLLKLNTSTFINISDLDFENADKLFFFSNQIRNTEAANFPLIKKANSNQVVNDEYILSSNGRHEELGKLSPNERNGLWGIIRIHMKGSNTGLNVTNSSGGLKNPHPQFQLKFRNRKTTWRYYFNESQVVSVSDDVKKENGNSKQLVTKKTQPLTFSGYVPIELGDVELPNPSVAQIKPDKVNNKIYSEIYM